MSASLDPHQNIDNAVIMKFTVAAGQTVKGGFEVIFASDDQEIQDAGANSALAIGVARRPGKTYAAGERVEVVMHGSSAIVPMTVGSTGVTRGKEVTQAADGIVDAADANAAGATVTWICGRALQAGLDNDVVGVAVYKSFRITA
jgi:hypothetical protein